MIDPTSVASQRISSYLLAIRDKLHLHLDVIILPSLKPGFKDIPMNKYYRFITGSVDATDTEEQFVNIPDRHAVQISVVDDPNKWGVEEREEDGIRCGENCDEPVRVEFKAYT